MPPLELYFTRMGDRTNSHRTIVILQPGYLPWLGFFDQMWRSDVFVLYDDVQYDKHGWRNRNRIKGPAGPHWLTVPVLHRGLGKPRIRDVRIDNTADWAKKHLGTIRQYYRRAPFLDLYFAELVELLERPWERLADLNLATTLWLSRKLGITREIHRSSELGIGGAKSERLLRLCEHFEATHYLSGDAARAYLDVDAFQAHGIEVRWHEYPHPRYRQQFEGFHSHLSALDCLLNLGPETGALFGSEVEGLFHQEQGALLNLAENSGHVLSQDGEAREV